jgi:CheY-like chemotaxis protein
MVQPRVLITDDDGMTLEMLQASLQDRYQVATANRGREAIAKAQANAFDLILLDVDMPEMDGYATCAALKAEPGTAEVPVIFLSARVNIEERIRGYRVGANDYLTKPFDIDELTTKIELAVAQRARNEALKCQIDDAMNTAMATADMYGEVGVVLELQRQLSNCYQYVDIASAFFVALENMGFDGCLRLTGRQGVMSRTARAECSALENSILDHVEAAKCASIQAMGDNTCFKYGNVLMLIRHLPSSPAPGQISADEADRLARVRDNIAMMAEGIVGRLRSLDTEQEKSYYVQSQKQVLATREALVDISAQQHANRMHLGQVFERMQAEVELSFIHLGLSETQEEQLSTTLHRYIDEAMGIFDHSNEIESSLNTLIERLGA